MTAIWLLAAGGSGLLGLSACQSKSPAPTPPAGHASAGATVASSVSPSSNGGAAVTISPADASADVALSTPVTISATGGRLTAISVRDDAGGMLSGSLDAAAGRWQSTDGLTPTTAYHVTATAVDADGHPTTVTSTFTTATPTRTLGAKIAPLDGETVGVAMPIVVYFTAPVTDRAAVERSLQVQESQPVLGAWHWYSNEEVHYRPTVYWPPGEKVTLHAALKGVDAGKGVWGVADHTVTFTVGDAHITTVDAKTDTMTVQVNGQTVRTAPVSLGRDKYPTTSGIHVVLEKTPSVVMDSTTVGIPKTSPDYYHETVLWDVRISWSGEFVHSAPWSVSEQGRENVSHGCVNASPDVAQWFYNLSRRGDVVVIRNTPRPLTTGNGWTDWNMTWSKWVAGSALGTGDGAGLDGGAVGDAQQGGLPDGAPSGAVNATYSPPPKPAPSTTVRATASATTSPSPSAQPSAQPTGTGSAKPPQSSPSPAPTSSGGTTPAPSPSRS